MPSSPSDSAAPPAVNLARLSAGIYGAALVLTLWLGALLRFGLSPQPFLDTDTWGYLHPALSKITGGAFEHTFGRDSLYPGFIYAILKASGDFRAISVAQHLLGLGTGALMALAWDGFCRLLLQAPANRLLPLALRLAGLLPVTAYLNSNLTLQYEHSLRPEAVFPFFVILSLWLNFAFIRRRWLEPAPGSSAALGAAALIISVIIYKLKSSFGFGVILVNLPVLISLTQPGMRWPLKTAMAGGAALFCIVFLILPESALKKDDPFSRMFLPDTLFAIHADLIADQLDADLVRDVPAPVPRTLLMGLRTRLSLLLPLSRRPESFPYPSLGFNPDYLMYVDNPFTPLLQWTPEGRDLRAKTEFYLYRRAALHQPWRMLGKIARQLGHFYRFGINTKSSSFGTNAGPVSAFYADNFSLLDASFKVSDPKSLTQYAPAQTLKSDSLRLSKIRQRIPVRRFSNYVRAQLCQLYLPGLLASLALGGWAARDERRRQWLMPTLLVLLVYGYNFGNNLTIAIVHSLDVDRYVANELAFTMFASAAGLVFVGTTIYRFSPLRMISEPLLEGIKSFAAWSGGAMAPALRHTALGSPPPTLCVLIPCYNEAVGVGGVVAEYRAAFPDARLLVVDNASSDGTADAARAAGAEVLYEPGRGKARAVLSGLSAIDSDLVLMVDGDGSYPAEGGKRLIAAYLEAPADLITGIRFSDEAASGSFRPLHQGGTQLFGKVIGWLFGWRSEDVFSGLRLFSRRFYQNVPILSRGFELELELTVQALDKGFSLRELPVPFGQRAAGTVSKLRTVQDGTRILRALFVLFRDFRPLLCFGAVSVALASLSLLAGSVPINDYITTRYVSHLPLAVLAASLMILAALALQTGLVLESGLRRSREAYQLQLRRDARSAAGSDQRAAIMPA